MNSVIPQSRFLIGLTAALLLTQAMVGCAPDQAATPAKRQVDVLLEQALAEQIAPGRDVVISYAKSPPNMTGKWHWHPSETFHYYLQGSVEIEFRDGTKIVGVPGRVNHVPYGAWHRATSGDEGVHTIIFRVHQAGEPVRHLQEDAPHD